MTLVVSNTTPLIGLSILDNFALLKNLFGYIQIPSAVYQEIVVNGVGLVGAAEVSRGIHNGWITVKDLSPSNILTTLKTDLDDGEAEAIALALKIDADLVLIDERKARIKAKSLNLNIIGTVGVLLLAKELGEKIDIKTSLDQLRDHNFRISNTLYRQILS